MSKTALMLFAACVGLSLLSLHLVKQMRDGDATIAELQARIANLESERDRAPPPPQEPTPPPAATWHIEPVAPPAASPPKETSTAALAKPAASAPPEAVLGTVPSREDRMRMLREARERQRQLMQDPEYREAMRVQQRSNMTRQYPGVAQELGLTADQSEQLFDLLAEQQIRNNEHATVMWDTEGLDPATMQQRQEKMQQHWMEMQRKNEAELAAQLGPDKLQAWKDYQSTLGARHQAEQLRTSLAGRGVPLSEDASRAVMRAYAESQKAEMQEYANMARAHATANAPATPSSSSGRIAIAGSSLRSIATSPELYDRQLENAKKRNQRVLDALSPYLTYEQREALQKEQEAELKMQEAQIRIMRAQSNLNGNNGGWVSSSPQAIILPAQ